MALFTWMLGRLYCKFKSYLNSATAAGKTARVVCAYGFDIIRTHLMTLQLLHFMKGNETLQFQWGSIRQGLVRFPALHVMPWHLIVFISFHNFLFFFKHFISSISSPASPHLFALLHPCAWHLSKCLLLLLCLGSGLHLRLGLRKPQSLDLQGCFSCKSHAKGSTSSHTHYIWLQSLNFRIFFYFLKLNFILL